MSISTDLNLVHDLALSETGQFFLHGGITDESVKLLDLALLRRAETHATESPRPLTAQEALDLGLIDDIVGDFPRPPAP
jgi:hypothetical protein